MKSAIVGFLFLACIGSSFALKCYVCSSAKGIGFKTGCGDPFDKATVNMTECRSGETCQKTKNEALSIVAVTRSCVSTCQESSTDVLGIKEETKCCNTEGCNGADSGHVRAVSAILSAMFAWLFATVML